MKNSSDTKLYKSVAYATAALCMVFGRYLAARVLSRRWGNKIEWKPTPERVYIQCPGGNTWYAEIDGPAAAPPLVFIHGINANHTQWYFQRRYFNTEYRLVFLTIPMKSSNGNYRLAIPALADDVNYVLQQLGISNAVIYGHSMGGMVLLQYCLQYAAGLRAKAIVLHGASYINPVLTNRFSSLLAPLQRSVLVPFFTFLKKHHRFFTLLSTFNYYNGLSVTGFRFSLFSGQQTANQLLFAASMAPSNDTGSVAESILQLMHFDVREQLHHINLPVLIIGGIYDRFNTIACNRYMKRHLAAAELRIIAAGHQGMIEKHEEVNKAVNAFIQQVSLHNVTSNNNETKELT